MYSGSKPEGVNMIVSTAPQDENKIVLKAIADRNYATISEGGTGATTAADALTNLGIYASGIEVSYCQGVTSSIQN
jgi:hypothetical protein